MRDPQQCFQMLAEQFKVLEHDLRLSRNAEQRAELLKGMNTVLVIEELDQLILANQSWLDSSLAGTASTNRPLSTPPTNRTTATRVRVRTSHR
jgi:hypothetical protein